MGLSEQTKQKVQNTLREAESRLEEIRDEIKKMESRYQDLLSQEKVVEKQLWLAQLLLDTNNRVAGESPESTETQSRYAGITIPAAAERIIEEQGRMLSSREIADVLIESGRVFASVTNATASITTSIKRHPEKFFWENVGGVNRFGLVKNRESEKSSMLDAIFGEE